jgi:hypothetical protein
MTGMAPFNRRSGWHPRVLVAGGSADELVDMIRRAMEASR